MLIVHSAKSVDTIGASGGWTNTLSMEAGKLDVKTAELNKANADGLIVKSRGLFFFFFSLSFSLLMVF
jgi:hypothetical protein